MHIANHIISRSCSRGGDRGPGLGSGSFCMSGSAAFVCFDQQSWRLHTALGRKIRYVPKAHRDDEGVANSTSKHPRSRHKRQ